MVKTRTKEYAEMDKMFNFHVEAFSGDPQTFMWFKNQVMEYIKLNKLNDEVGLFFLKSKLSGAALNFFSTCPNVNNIDKVADALKILEDFFVNKATPASALNEFNSLRMIHGETVKNLKHRINLAAQCAYPFIADQTALNKIKAIQFLNAIPQSLRDKLFDADQDDFESLTAKAEKIDGMFQNFACANVITGQSEPNSQISALASKLDQLALIVTNSIQKCQICQEVDHITKECPLLKSKSEVDKQTKFCVFCGMKNHLMMNCRAYKNSLSGNKTQLRPNSQPGNRRNGNESSLNFRRER